MRDGRGGKMLQTTEDGGHLWSLDRDRGITTREMSIYIELKKVYEICNELLLWM